MQSFADWKQAATNLTLQGQCYLDGQYVPAASGQTIHTLNPANGKPLTQLAAGAQEDINRAVRSGKAAFDEGHWKNRPPRERGQVLIRLAELLEKNAHELQLLETLDIGKPVRYTGRIDLNQAQYTFRWYGELADKLYDEVAPTHKDVVGLITREPVGVVGVITPWNFPMMIMAWKLAPALVTGNSVVLKPAEQSSLTALRIAALATEAGLPPGVLNVVPGLGEDAGKPLALHPDVDAIAFTGSTEVGKLLLQYAGQSNMKRVSLETGGKTPNILFADTPDLDYALKAVGFSMFWNTGQMCVAGSRLLVHDSIYEEVVERVAAEAKIWAPGNPLDPGTRAGPVVDPQQYQRVLQYIEQGLQEGARLVTGGNRAHTETGGYFVEPTVFADVSNEMTIAREEIFGPVLGILRFSEEEEAIRIANDTVYGLSAAVWTRDLARAHRVSQALRAGTVWVNNFDQADMTAPFGGWKQSGFGGKDKSKYAIDKYTNLKTTWINIGRGGH